MSDTAEYLLAMKAERDQLAKIKYPNTPWFALCFLDDELLRQARRIIGSALPFVGVPE